jgi:hypothetical protein
LSPTTFTTCLRRRLGLPVHMSASMPFTCPACGLSSDPLGDHALACKSSPHHIIRHNRLRDLVYAIAKEVTTVELEVKVQQRRPGDVFFHDLFEQPTAVDFAVVSPFVLSATNPFPPRWLAKKQVQDAEKQKMQESAELCSSRGFGFIPAGFDVVGGRGEGATRVLEELEQKLKLKTPAGSRGGASLFARAHTCIARSVGTYINDYFNEVVKFGDHLKPPPTPRTNGPTPTPPHSQSQPFSFNFNANLPPQPQPSVSQSTTPTPFQTPPIPCQAVSNSGSSPPAAHGEMVWANTETHPNLRPDGKLEHRGRPMKVEDEVISGCTPPNQFGSGPVAPKARAKPRARKVLVVYAASFTQRDCPLSGFAMFINNGHHRPRDPLPLQRCPLRN